VSSSVNIKGFVSRGREPHRYRVYALAKALKVPNDNVRAGLAVKYWFIVVCDDVRAFGVTFVVDDAKAWFGVRCAETAEDNFVHLGWFDFKGLYVELVSKRGRHKQVSC
jgi:hypothetical protein